MLGGAVVVESIDVVVVRPLDAGAEAAGLTKIAVIKATASVAAVSLQVVDEFAMVIITPEQSMYLNCYSSYFVALRLDCLHE